MVCVPLSLCKLEAEPVQHELVLVCHNLFRSLTFRSEFKEFFERMNRYVLVYRPITHGKSITVSDTPPLSKPRQREHPKTHANCLHFSISLSKCLFSYSKFCRPRCVWSISMRASAVACLCAFTEALAARLSALRREKRAPARIWMVVGSALRVEESTKEWSCSMTASGRGGSGRAAEALRSVARVSSLTATVMARS